nr:MAG: hypothetical protein [Microviridae sp.]
MDNETVFAMYFCSVAGWQYHPGSGHGEHKILSLVQARDIALQMVLLHREVYPLPRQSFCEEY